MALVAPIEYESASAKVRSVTMTSAPHAIPTTNRIANGYRIDVDERFRR